MEEKEKDKKENIRILINLGFLIAIIFVCVILTTTIIMFYKNMEIIRNDPITYVMKEMNFTSCECEFGSKGAALCGCNDINNKYWRTSGSGFIHERSYDERFSNIITDININEVK